MTNWRAKEQGDPYQPRALSRTCIAAVRCAQILRG